MNPQTFDTVASVLTGEPFRVDASAVGPETRLDALGLDSLALMEFVFAIEDRFDVRIPEEKLDPRQAGVTLGDLAGHLDDAVAAKGADAAAADAASGAASNVAPATASGAASGGSADADAKPAGDAAAG